MATLRLHLLGLFLAAAGVLRSAEVDPETTPGGVDLPLPKNGAAYYHQDADLHLPQALASLKLNSIHQWDDPAAGLGFRYYHPQEPMRAEIFLYRAPRAMETREEKLEAVRVELAKVWLNAQRIQKDGRYKDLKNSPPKMDALNLPPKDETLLAHTSLSMVIQQRDAEPYKAEMWYGVIPFHRYWLRLRITLPEGSIEDAELKAQNFVKAVVQTVQEPGMRAEALRCIQLYAADPLSEPARTAADFVGLFGQENPCFQIIVPRQVTKLLAAADGLRPDARLDLQRAFIVGAVEKSIAGASRAEANQAGVGLMDKTLTHLKLRFPSFTAPDLDAMTKAVKDGKIEAWLAQPGT